MHLKTVVSTEISTGKGPTLIIVPACIRAQWRLILKSNRLKVDVVSYEELANNYSNGKIHKAAHVIWHRIILDEAHRIRKKNTVSYKVCMSLHALIRGAITGTPIVDSRQDLRSLRLWANTKMNKPGSLTNVTYSGSDSDYSSWNVFGSRSEFAKILPRVEFHVHDIRRHPMDIKAEQNSIVPNDCAHMKRRLAALSPMLANDGGQVPSGHTKVDEILDIVSKTTSSSSTIIFTNFLTEQTLLYNALNCGKNVVRRIYGRVSHEDRHRIHTSVETRHTSKYKTVFLLQQTIIPTDVIRLITTACTSRNITIMQMSCGSVGLNLQMYNQVVFANPGWSPADDEQAYARAARMGQKDTVHIHWVYADDNENTIDNRIRHIRKVKQTTIKKYTSLMK